MSRVKFRFRSSSPSGDEYALTIIEHHSRGDPLKKVSGSTIIGISVALLLSGCAVVPTVETSTAAGTTITPEQKASPLGPEAPADGRVPADGNVTTPASLGSLEGVFCNIAIDGKITAYQAFQVRSFAENVKTVAASENLFNEDMGYKNIEEAAAVGKKFSSIGLQLAKLTQEKNINIPASWEDRIDGLCDDALNTP